jgi:Ca2+-binding EF-hand superfamily protein
MPELDPETLQRMRAEFSRFDTDENGLIDRAEFEALISALGAGLSHSESDRAFGDIDENDNGRIEFDEFARWWRFHAGP